MLQSPSRIDQTLPGGRGQFRKKGCEKEGNTVLPKSFLYTMDGWNTVEKKKKPSKAERKERKAPPTLEEIVQGRPKVLIVLRGLPGSGKVNA